MAYPATLWNPLTSYSTGNVVFYAGLDYASLVNANVGNNPASTLGTKWQLNTTYAAGTTYAIGNQVDYNGIGYVSVANSNTGHTPGSAGNTTYWEQNVVRYDIANPPPLTYINLTAASGAPAMTPYDVPNPNPVTNVASPNNGQLLYYRVLYPSPRTTPGYTTSIWIGRVIFRVVRTGYYFGLGQKANTRPVSHNSGVE